MRTLSRFLAAGAFLAIAIPCTSRAAEPSRSRVITDQWLLNVGGYLVELDTEAQVGRGAALGTLLDLEDTLDYDPTRSVGRIDSLVRFKPKHALELGLLAIDREASGTFDDVIQFRNRSFDAGFESEFDMRLFKAGYRYSFDHDDRIDAGLTVGLSTFRFSLSIAGEISDPNGTTVLGRDKEEATVLAPVPYFGIFLDYAFTPRWVTRASPQFFNIESGDIEGRYLDFRWTLDFYFSKHVGIGAGYEATDLRFENSNDHSTHVQYRYSGVLAYLAFVGGKMEPSPPKSP
jgi:hypothetical protein